MQFHTDISGSAPIISDYQTILIELPKTIFGRDEMKNFLYLSVIISLIVGSQSFAYADQNLREEWMDVSSRCRISVETEQPIDETDLVLVEADSEALKNDVEYSFKKWRFETGRFIVEEYTWTRGLSSMRMCSVNPDPSKALLSEQEIALLVRDFLIERERLIHSGGHEIRDNSQTYPMVILSSGLKERKDNGNGCLTSSTVFFDTKQFFMYASGDQITSHPCKYFLDPVDRAE